MHRKVPLSSKSRRQLCALSLAQGLVVAVSVLTLAAMSGCAVHVTAPQSSSNVQTETPGPASGHAGSGPSKTASEAATTGPAPSANATHGVSGAYALAKAHGLRLSGRVRTVHDILPPTLDDPFEEPTADALMGGGYDLKPYAGKRVTFTIYGVVAKPGDRRRTRFVYLESGGRFIGAYINVVGVAPGEEPLP